MTDTARFKSPQSISDGVIALVKLEETDVSEKYVQWLNNPEVNRFLECRFKAHTISSTRKYIAALAEPGSNEFIFGIYIERESYHIGNIKIGPINPGHKHATVGLMIGETSEWGKGYASRSIRLITEYAVRRLGLESLNAGCYSQNIGSYKSFLKAGWKSTGKIASHWIDNNGNRSDELILSFQKPKEICLPDHGGITFIGGGIPMLETACRLRQAGYSLLVVFSPRHSDDSAINKLKDAGCEVVITQDINNDERVICAIKMFDRLCLCFGPAWIFRDQLLEIFNGRIFNFNGIPIPNYLGGAHFTWQILNRDLSGGVYLQQITRDIDRGIVVDFESYTLPESCKIPSDYYNYNDFRSIEFLASFIDRHLLQGAPIVESPIQPDWSKYSYFPRLSTAKCAWIDWSWDGQQVEDFCNGFDDPYSGAMTFMDGLIVTLTNVLYREGAYFHPYFYGLIIYSDAELIRIAVKGGCLEVAVSNVLASGSILSLSCGDRLVTPRSRLEGSLKRVRYSAHGVTL